MRLDYSLEKNSAAAMMPLIPGFLLLILAVSATHVQLDECPFTDYEGSRIEPTTEAVIHNRDIDVPNFQDRHGFRPDAHFNASEVPVWATQEPVYNFTIHRAYHCVPGFPDSHYRPPPFDYSSIDWAKVEEDFQQSQRWIGQITHMSEDEYDLFDTEQRSGSSIRNTTNDLPENKF